MNTRFESMRWPASLALILFSLLFIIFPASAGPLFDPATTAAVGIMPQSARIADLNRDGRPDLVVGNVWSSSVSILIGNGDGSFQPRRDYALLPLGRSPKCVEVRDLNDDGNLDLAFANQGSHNVGVMLGNGDGTFRSAVWYPSAALGTHGLDLSDLNRDGKLDLAAVGWDANVVAIRYGRGDGSFGAQSTYPTGNKPGTVALNDYNRDGYVDVAVANYRSASVSVLLSDRAGGFAPQVAYSVVGGPVTVRAADLDRDGDLDLVTSNDWSSNASVLLGRGDGTFNASVAYQTGVKPKYLYIADVNGDSKPDILAANTNGNFPSLVIPGGDTVSVLLGVGDGTFLPRTDYTVGQGPFQVVAGDLNCDGAPDLVVANYWDNNVSILMNTMGSRVPCGSSAGLP